MRQPRCFRMIDQVFPAQPYLGRAIKSLPHRPLAMLPNRHWAVHAEQSKRNLPGGFIHCGRRGSQKAGSASVFLQIYFFRSMRFREPNVWTLGSVRMIRDGQEGVISAVPTSVSELMCPIGLAHLPRDSLALAGAECVREGSRFCETPCWGSKADTVRRSSLFRCSTVTFS